VIRFLRALIGSALGLVVVTAPSWGLFHLVRQSSCGTILAPTGCPDDVGLWIAALVVSTTVVAPLAVLLAGRDRDGGPWLLGPLIVLVPVGLVAGVVVSFVGVSADPGTRWVGILIGGVVGLLTLLGIRAAIAGRRRAAYRRGTERRPGAGAPRGRPAPSSPPPTPPPQRPAAAPDLRTQQLGTLAAQLTRVAAAARTGPDTVAPRLKHLDELRRSGLITDDEHASRRREILAEI
jgi:hypothetical protein